MQEFFHLTILQTFASFIICNLKWYLGRPEPEHILVDRDFEWNFIGVDVRARWDIHCGNLCGKSADNILLNAKMHKYCAEMLSRDD